MIPLLYFNYDLKVLQFLTCSHVKAKKYMTVNFICFFDMHHYPFDIQVCKNTIMPVPNSDTFVKLIGKDIIYDGPRNLMKYDVNITLEDSEVNILIISLS